jgi:hypothetical protein
MRISANTSNGKRIEMRRSPFGVFSMYPFYHTNEDTESTPDLWLKPSTPIRTPSRDGGLRRAKAPFFCQITW